MKWSKTHLFTLRDAPSDAEINSHKLMVRAGLVKKIGPGLYTYGTFALRSLRKLEHIIREELDSRDCQELLMPMVQPRELWEESGRWTEMGEGLLKFKNRNDHWFCLGATHEEVITDYIRHDIKSYRQLPATLYQIQTKYRDELRPRFGLMRCREFLMKDAYSFDRNVEDALSSYERLYAAYKAIFDRLGLEYRIVEADAGNIGGSQTHEFQVLAEAGEDHLMVCNDCDYAANVEIAPVQTAPETFGGSEQLALEKFATPQLRSIADLAKATQVAEEHLVKTMFFASEDEQIFTVLLRGSDEVNEIKLKNVLNLPNPPRLLTDDEVRKLTQASPGSCGPIGLSTKVYADLQIENYKNFMVGANEDDFHYKNVNFDRDFKVSKFIDLTKAKAGVSCPKCKGGTYQSFRGIEVGHCFYLGTKYSKKMNAQYLDDQGKSQWIEMGCYGIGVSRSIQAAIEQSHDADGIVWPRAIAPFDVHICVLDPKDEACCSVSEELQRDLSGKGYSSFVDDRNERPGIKFKDADLIGLPVRVVIGGRGVANNELELVVRKTKEKLVTGKESLASLIEEKLKQL